MHISSDNRFNFIPKAIYDYLKSTTSPNIDDFSNHRGLQLAITNFASHFNCSAISNFLVSRKESGRIEQIDVVWLYDRTLVCAFEIMNNRRSEPIERLLSISALYRVLVYYGHKSIDSLISQADPDRNIDFLELYQPTKPQLDSITKAETYSYTQVRSKYPNAYYPWTQEDDSLLLTMYSEGSTISRIAAHFLRTSGAIRSRLAKLMIPPVNENVRPPST